MTKRARMTNDAARATFTSLKGLMTAVPEEQDSVETGQVLELELGRIRPNPNQPRKSNSAGFSESSLEDLAANIREHGLLQPILVKDTGRFYQIVAGERRYRACQLLGLERVPVRIVEPRDEQDELQIALAENLQRKNLGALEEAMAFRTLIRRFGLSYRDLARLAGRSVAHVHGRLQLLEHEDVRVAVEEKRLGIADAIQLARVPDEASRKELLQAAADGSLRGAALHRQVQVFLGELTPASAEAQDRAERGRADAPSLSGALALVEQLPEELSEDDLRTLYTLTARAAERLGLRLSPAGIESPAATPPPQEHARHAPEPISADSRKVIARAKEFRDDRGYTLVNLIRVYWMNLERRGYIFTPGEWRAVPASEGRYLTSFSYKLDEEPRVLEWMYQPDGSMEPANDDARALLG